MKKKLFIGMMTNNIAQFASKCCHGALSIEPLFKVCCGLCGKRCSEDEVIHIDDLKSLLIERYNEKI